MKWFAALGFFVAEAVLIAIGVVRAASGQGTTVFWVALAVTAAIFIKFGCIDNSPKEH